MSGKTVNHTYYNYNDGPVTINTGDHPVINHPASDTEQDKTPSPTPVKANLFFSHRHAVSEDFAHLLMTELRPYIEGEIFIDSLSLHVGPFAEQLEARIKACDCFMLLIAEGTFRGIDGSQDWVRWELELALAYDRPILPVLKGTASFPLANELPASIRRITTLHGVRYYLEDRESSTRRLIEQFLRRLQR